MDFSYWMEVYNKSFPGSEEAKEALDKMVECARSFDEWKNVFYRAEPKSSHERMAQLQMTVRAKTFGQWLNVYHESFDNDIVEITALMQLMNLAGDPVDALAWTKNAKARKLSRWMQIAAVVPAGSREESFAIGKVIEELKKRKEKKASLKDPLKI